MNESLTDQPSILSKKIIKTGNLLQNSTNWQIAEFQKQLQKSSNLYDLILNDLIVDQFDHSLAEKSFKKFFGKNTINFVAIDGTEYARQFFDMIIFYAGAYSCFGSIKFDEMDIKIKYNEKFLGNEKDVSSCVPIFLNKIIEIDHTLYDSNQNKKQKTISLLTEESILDNTNISKSLMTFSEFFLAYRFASSNKVNLILLDRILSNMYSSLLYDTSNRKSWSNDCSILNYVIDDHPLDINDLTLCRHHIINELLDLPPSRGDYLRYQIYYKLLAQPNAMGFEELCKILNLQSNIKAINRIQKYIDRWVEEGVIEKVEGKYVIKKIYLSSWSRIKKLVNSIGNQIFDGEKDPFIINKMNDKNVLKKEWLTTTDLAFLTLFSLYMLIEECWKNNILLVGMAKDTTAHDFKNHLLPIGLENLLWTDNNDINIKVQKEIEANSFGDRTILQSLSLLNYKKIKVPWSLIEYDSAFIMAIPDRKSRKGYVGGAIRNKITPSKLFLRSFVQLEQARTNPMLRSNVLSIDRLVYPIMDLNSSTDHNILNCIHEYAGEENIQFILYKNNKTRNELQNLLMMILKSMGNPSIAESFGHNKALYIVDKIAKWHNEQFRNIVDSTNLLISNNKDLRNFVFYMNSFREKRQTYESNRR